MKKTLLATVVLVVGLSVGGCAKFDEQFKDAPRSGVENGEAADLVRMPDGFSNAATKCDHGNRIYTAFHGDEVTAAIFVVAQDPTCAKPEGTK
jgi:hypothetical protein